MQREISRDMARILASVAEVYEAQGNTGAAEVLRGSDHELLEIAYDNWNGGTYTYLLQLNIAPWTFASLEDSRAALEAELLDRVKVYTSKYPNDWLSAVRIVPALGGSSEARLPLPAREPSFWTPGYLRLFISHVSNNKLFASELSASLSDSGVSAFVAHSDIEPTKEWETEIVSALATMDALLALMTPGFETSRWASQEVGVAIGRGVLVIPVKMGLDPFGFIGRFQVLPASNADPAGTSDRVVRILAAHGQTRLRMAHGLVAAFEASETFAEAERRVEKLMLATVLPGGLRDRIRSSASSNRQIREAWGVRQRAEQIMRSVEDAAAGEATSE